ncbi:MAG TPA: response regulator [Candidatus Limnocylindrales bacterium]|nr:response regulator [Candidatus Limnocylindrales bacterium]
MIEAQQQENIVVIDDNPAARYSTSRILRSAGFEVAEAATGTDGIAMVRADTSLVVLDINLPDIDGFEVCRRLRAQPETERIPVVHLSATFVAELDKVKGFEAGADGYLIHPVEPQVLIATVKALVRTRRAEEATRKSEARFRAVFDQVPTGIALLSEDMTYVNVNPAMCRLLGRSSAELIGINGAALVAAEHKHQIPAVRRQLKEHGHWQGFFPLERSDRSLVDLEWNLSTFSPGVYLAMASDVTERRRVEAERERLLQSERAARSEAERANRIKDDFLATLSHELRNPLHVIVGWAGVLTQVCNDPQLLSGLQAMERSADLLAHLIADLLDVSRITSGKLSLNTEVVNLGSVLDAAIAVVTPSSLAKQIRIERTPGDEAAFVLGDPARLQQVAWNLLANAIKFTPRGGVVRASLQRADSHVVLEVSDTGRGIAPDFLPHIFERFRQEGAGSKSGGGLGLGLAIVKHLVEMHGGSVRAASAGEGRGATFTVTLPVSLTGEAGTRTHAARRPGSPLSAHDLTGLRVLIVDDDPGARAPVRRILTEAGAEVAEAGDVPEALRHLESFAPSLLVSDIGMAEQDGYDLIREIRRRGYGENALPALALTAFAQPEDRRAVLAAGYQMHLTKPVDAQQLLVAVTALAGIAGDETALP